MSVDRYTGSPDIRFYPLPSDKTEKMESKAEKAMEMKKGMKKMGKKK